MGRRTFFRGEKIILTRGGKNSIATFVEKLNKGSFLIVNDSDKLEVAYYFEVDYIPDQQAGGSSKKNAS